MPQDRLAHVPPFMPNWRYVRFHDVQCFDWVKYSFDMSEAEKKQQVEVRLVQLLKVRNAMITGTADLQTYILAMLLVVKNQVYPPVLELGFQAMGRTPAVKTFMKEFLDYALLLKHPLVRAIKQGSIKLPPRMTAEADRSMYSLKVLDKSVNATCVQNMALQTSYQKHCRVFEQLMGVLTHNPHNPCGLLGQLSRLCFVPTHQLPCSREASWDWHTKVRLHSQLFLFRDPRKATRADLGAVEASCYCISSNSDTLQQQWQLTLEAAPAPSSMQSQGSSGSASDEGASDDNHSSNSAAAAPTTPTLQQPAAASSQEPSAVPETQPASGRAVLPMPSPRHRCRTSMLRSQVSHSCPMLLPSEGRSVQSQGNAALACAYDWEVSVWSWLQALML